MADNQRIIVQFGAGRFEIVEGITREGERVYRVVEYAMTGNLECLGGRGSFFKYADAVNFIEAELFLARQAPSNNLQTRFA